MDPSGTDISYWKRSDAKSYALVANKEGYDYGGGCWNDNDSDDFYYPAGAGQAGHHGEGGDCSGFTFKSWALKKTQGHNGKHRWDNKAFIHGPYQAWEFKTPQDGWPILNQQNEDAKVMDAFASSSHIGMVWWVGTGGGQDTIIEALNEDSGTLIHTQNHRGQMGIFEATRRSGWTPECVGNQCV
jgi:hypothetical protein